MRDEDQGLAFDARNAEWHHGIGGAIIVRIDAKLSVDRRAVELGAEYNSGTNPRFLAVAELRALNGEVV